MTLLPITVVAEMQVVVPPTAALPEMRLIDETVDPLALESVFQAPGRNEPCHCGSGDKYKRCCQSHDQEAWRFVVQKTRQAEAACAMLRGIPSSYPLFDPEPE